MNITLRQAHKLVEKLTRLQNSITLNRTGGINIWTVAASTMNNKAADPTKVQVAIDSQAATFTVECNRKLHAVQFRAAIRERIQTKNQSSGINNAISQRKLALDVLSVYKSVDQNDRDLELSTAAALSGKITQLLNAEPGRQMFGGEVVSFVVPFNNNVKKEIVDLERQIEQIDDQLTTLNASTTINLLPVEVEFLKSENLI